MIFEIESNLVFPSLCKSTLALEFVGDALPQVLFKIKSYLDENQVIHLSFILSLGVSKIDDFGRSRIRMQWKHQRLWMSRWLRNGKSWNWIRNLLEINWFLWIVFKMRHSSFRTLKASSWWFLMLWRILSWLAIVACMRVFRIKKRVAKLKFQLRQLIIELELSLSMDHIVRERGSLQKVFYGLETTTISACIWSSKLSYFIFNLNKINGN